MASPRAAPPPRGLQPDPPLGQLSFLSSPHGPRKSTSPTTKAPFSSSPLTKREREGLCVEGMSTLPVSGHVLLSWPTENLWSLEIPDNFLHLLLLVHPHTAKPVSVRPTPNCSKEEGFCLAPFRLLYKISLPGCLTNSCLFLRVLEPGRPKIKFLADLGSGEGLLPSLATSSYGGRG